MAAAPPIDLTDAAATPATWQPLLPDDGSVALGDLFAHWGGSGWVLLFSLTALALLLTEVMSNVALVSVFIPVVASVAIGRDFDPLTLCVPVTLAASCAFMLPMSTPPNAIVFASGRVRIAQMIRAGIVLNIVAVLWISTLCRWIFR